MHFPSALVPISPLSVAICHSWRLLVCLLNAFVLMKKDVSDQAGWVAMCISGGTPCQ